jgi:hypothetical protein
MKIYHSKQELEKNINNLDSPILFLDTDEKEIRKIIEFLKAKGKQKPLAVFGRDNNFNRRVIETCKISFLISPERETEEMIKKGERRRDSLKQRDSGLNHVLAKEAIKKGIEIVIDFSEIKKIQGKQQALRLARVIQNIKICRKAKCKILIWDFSEKEKATNKELMNFAFSLGMSSQQAKEAIKE